MCSFALLLIPHPHHAFFFFFNDTATTEIYTLSLHDALPISFAGKGLEVRCPPFPELRLTITDNGLLDRAQGEAPSALVERERSEEHTSELQSPDHLVCRLLLEKKKRTILDSHIDRYMTQAHS